METHRITIEAKTARDLYREYKKHQHYSAPIDDEIRRAYQLLAQGRLVIRALESVRTAGLNKHGLPKLAICRAHSETCYLHRYTDGRADFTGLKWLRADHVKEVIKFSAGSFAYPPANWFHQAEAVVPPVPLNLRPKRGLQNYHILWEAEWTKIIPRDPYLLRRIGKSDMWLVVAMWDLSEVERAALAARITPQ